LICATWCVGAVVAALVAISATASFAQAAAPVGPTAASTLAAVPTTKLLAIGSFTAKATPNVWTPVLPSEVRETVRVNRNNGGQTERDGGVRAAEGIETRGAAHSMAVEVHYDTPGLAQQ
jgi:hypothetical protein